MMSYLTLSGPFRDTIFLEYGLKVGIPEKIARKTQPSQGITGRNVTIVVADDGLEWRHPDIQPNYR